MATLQHSYEPQTFHVLHPLDDVAEKKCTSEGLGPIAMTRTVRVSLKILRGYLILMTMLLLYHVLDLAGFIHAL